MSLFGSMMGDFDDDMFMNNPMNMMQMQMRNMNRMMNSLSNMNSLMPDPFNMLMPFDNGRQQNNMLMDRNNGPPGMNGFFGFPMANMNRLLNTDGMAPNGGTSYCSSSVISMSSGPDGRPQIYQATTSSKTGPGGIRETRKTVQDSMNGVKKMAIGHHIGERAHIIEKEEDMRSGQLEERQEFINLDEEEAELFDREFTTKANPGGRHQIMAGPHGREVLTIQDVDDDEDEEEINRHHRRPQLALLPAPSSQSKSVQHPHPYKNAMPSRRQRGKKQLKEQQQFVHQEIEELQKKHQQNQQHQDYEEVIDDGDDNDDDDDDEPQVIIEEPDDDDDEDDDNDRDEIKAK